MAGRRGWAVPGLTLTLALGAAGCAPAPQPEAGGAAPAGETLVWPPPPAPARLRFERSIARPADLGIRKGFLDRLGELFTGPEETRLIRPMAVVRAAGVLFVADPGARGVHRFDPGRSRYDLVRGPGGADLPSPVGLAAGPRGEVYVTDAGLSQVLRIAPGATEARPLPLRGLLAQPTGIALDRGGGRIFLVDTGSHQVKVYARDGALLQTIGRRGKRPGEFNFPTMIWRADDGTVLVADSLNFRIQRFDDRGRFLGAFGEAGLSSGHHARPKGVATDRFGHVYVVDSLFHAVQIFDERGAFLLGVGSQGHGPGEFWLPTGIFVAGDDRIYVADSHNRRVQVFRYVGGAS